MYFVGNLSLSRHWIEFLTEWTFQIQCLSSDINQPPSTTGHSFMDLQWYLPYFVRQFMQTLLKYATRPIAWLTFNPHTTLVISRRTESVVIDSPKLLRGCGSCPIRSSGQAASPAALLLRQKVWQRAGAISFLLMAAVIFSPVYHIMFSKSSKKN